MAMFEFPRAGNSGSGRHVMQSLRAPITLVLILLTASAHAEVRQSSSDSFLISFSDTLATTPPKAFTAIAQVQHWWSDDFTWSGKAANLSLNPTASGCFCERWKDGSVEHGRVILVVEDRLLRIDGALGPLQQLAVKGTLDFLLDTGADGATRLNVDYRVIGASTSALDTIAPQINKVLGAQIARLVRYINSGNPEQPASATPSPEPSDIRAALLHAWATQATDDKSPEAKKMPAPQKPGKKP